MNIRASSGASGRFGRAPRLLPAPGSVAEDGVKSETRGQPAEPRRSRQSDSRPVSVRPQAAFLAQLALQYGDRADRAAARRQRQDDARRAYSAALTRRAAMHRERVRQDIRA